MNSIQGVVFQPNNALPHTIVLTERDLQSVDMLPWPARTSNQSLIKHVWDIIRRQLKHHPHSALTVPVLTLQVQQAWDIIPQSDIRHLYYTSIHACRPAFKLLEAKPAINLTAFHICSAVS
ncbi:uncharacterized protein TNCV_4543521 [Trichonephila clavipes]|nr:uncharacterized protein TNCV_4543521 [Trichonephila clavipes]